MAQLASLLLLSSVSVGQVSENHEHLKAVDWTMGNWKLEKTLEKDGLAAKKGDSITKRWIIEWTRNKNAIRLTNLVAVNGQVKGQLDSMFGWSQRKQQIVGVGFYTEGGAAGGWTLVADDKKITITAKSGVWTFQLAGPDKLMLSNDGGLNEEYVRVKKQSRKTIRATLELEEEVAER